MVVLLCACSSSVEPEYYTLSSVNGPVLQGKIFTIKIRRAAIPETLDRPEMVSQSEDFRIHENDNRQWAEPLDTMIERVLAEDVRQRLPGKLIVTESSGVAVQGAYVVDVDVTQLGTDKHSNAFLETQIVIHYPNGKIISLPATLHGMHVTSAEYMAKGLSILLGDLANKIAITLVNPTKLPHS